MVWNRSEAGRPFLLWHNEPAASPDGREIHPGISTEGSKHRLVHGTYRYSCQHVISCQSCLFAILGAGASTVISMLISFQQSLVGEIRDELLPVPGDLNDSNPTTCDVQLFSDPGTYDDKAPILYADCEGLGGSDQLPKALEALQRSGGYRNPIIQHNRLKAISKSDLDRNPRRKEIANILPQILLALSDVVVLVTKNTRYGSFLDLRVHTNQRLRTLKNLIFQSLISWAQSSPPERRVKPHLIIVHNAAKATGPDEIPWETDPATEKYLGDLNMGFDDDLITKSIADNIEGTDRHRFATIRDLIQHFHASVTVVRLPVAPNYTVMDRQVKRLYDVIAEKSTQSHLTKSKSTKDLDADRVARLRLFDLFSEVVESPFDFSSDLVRCLGSGSRDIELMGSILRILVVAARPLTLEELAFAVADCRGTEHIRRTIMEDLQGFITCDNERAIKISHSAVIAALQAIPWDNRTTTERVQRFHELLGQRCIQFLLRVKVNDNCHPFLDYSAINWAGHIHRCGESQTKYRADILTLCNQHDLWFSRYWQARDPSKPLPDSLNALTVAACCGFGDAVLSFLVERGADLPPRDPMGMTVLHLASSLGLVQTVTNLIKTVTGLPGSLDLNCRDLQGATPLHHAARNRQRAIVALLVSAGAYINAQDNQSRTPVHFAAGWGDEGTLTELLKGDFDLEMADADSNTPLMVAKKELESTPMESAERNIRTAVFELLETAEFSQLRLSNELSPDTAAADVLFYLQGTVIDPDNPGNTLHELPRHSLYDFLRMKTIAEEVDNGNRVKWFHLPANNVTNPQSCFTTQDVSPNMPRC